MKGKGMMLALAAAMLGMSGSAEATPQVRDAAPAVAAPLTVAAAYGQRDWRDNRDRSDWRGDRGDMRGERRGWDRRHRGWDRGYGYGRYRSCWNVRRYGRWERVCRWRRR